MLVVWIDLTVQVGAVSQSGRMVDTSRIEAARFEWAVTWRWHLLTRLDESFLQLR